MSILQSQFIIIRGYASGTLDRSNMLQYCHTRYKDMLSSYMNDSGYVFAYHIEKVKPRKERTDKSRPYRYRHLGGWSEDHSRQIPIFEAKGETLWLITYYAFPKRNVKNFVQHGNHFDITLVSDEMLQYMERLEVGHPPHTNGWFPMKEFEGAQQAIRNEIAIRHHRYFKDNVRPIPPFMIEFDPTGNRFCFKDLSGNLLIGEALKNIVQF